MDGHRRPPHMSDEQFEEARRLMGIAELASRDELWRMCCLMASKENNELFGQTEFELRDRLLRIGANTLQAAVELRRKKGGT